MITLKNKEYPVSFSYKAIKWFMQSTGLTFADFEDKMMQHMDELLYYGLKSADKNMTLSKEDILDILDEDISLITVVSEMFADDMNKIEKKKKPTKGRH